MVFFRQYPPHPALQAFVRHYFIIHLRFDANTPREQLPTKPYSPSTEQCLYFYPYDLPLGVKAANQAPERVSSAILVGQQLSRMNITINANYLMLKVSFQPGGLFRLLGVPMSLFTDGHADLEALTGRAVKEVTERLPQATDYAAMVGLVEALLLRKAAQCRQALLPIDRVAQRMLDPAAYHQLDRLASNACLSVRQFERKFREWG